jgi:replicative DNA helicase
MDIERSIITICAMNPEASYPEALDSALTPELFEGEAKEIWAFAERFLKTHGRGPSVDAIQAQFDKFEPAFPSEPLSYYIEQLKKKHAFNLTIEAIKSAHKHLSAREVDEAVSQLSEAMRRIQDTTSGEADLNWRDSTKDRYDHYLKLQTIGGIDGYTTPFPTLDEATQGIHDGEFILIVARQGVGKTWLSNVLAHENLKQGLKVLYFTKEMPSKQIARRFDALVYDLPYQDLRRGTLDSFRERDWQKEVERPKVDGELIIVGEESGGVGHVAAKIERYKPDIVYIDGMYLMEDDQRAREQWQRIGNVSRDLKRLAKRVNVPILATVQFNRNADNSSGDTSNIAGSDIAKDADLILGLFQTEDQRLARQMTLKVLKQREGSRPEIECDWDMDAMKFSEAQEHDDPTGISW